MCSIHFPPDKALKNRVLTTYEQEYPPPELLLTPNSLSHSSRIFIVLLGLKNKI